MLYSTSHTDISAGKEVAAADNGENVPDSNISELMFDNDTSCLRRLGETRSAAAIITWLSLMASVFATGDLVLYSSFSVTLPIRIDQLSWKSIVDKSEGLVIGEGVGCIVGELVGELAGILKDLLLVKVLVS